MFLNLVHLKNEQQNVFDRLSKALHFSYLNLIPTIRKSDNSAHLKLNWSK